MIRLVHGSPEGRARSRLDRWTTLLWYVGCAAGVWSYGYARVRAADLWWHLAAGRWIATHLAIPSFDPGWSFTAPGPWIDEAWASDLFLHIWTRIGGVESLVWWKWGVTGAAYLVLMRAVHIRTKSAPVACLVSLFAAGVASPFLDLRPQLYSIAGFAALLLLAAVPPRLPWGLPILFLIWANLHPLVLLGLGALVLIAAVNLLRWTARERRRGPLIVAVCAVACMVNGYGPGLIVRPLRYAFVRSIFTDVAEWLSPFVPGGMRSPMFPWALALLVLALIKLLTSPPAEGEERRPIVEIVLAALGVLLAVRSRRFIPIFGILASPALALALLRAVPRRVRDGLRGPVNGRSLREARETISASTLAAGAGVDQGVEREATRGARDGEGIWRALRVVGACAVLAWGGARLATKPLGREAFVPMAVLDNFPVETVRFAELNHIAGRVFGLYAWGGYLAYETDGRLQVFVDGRADMLYDAKTLEEYLAVKDAKPPWETILASRGADLVLWPRNETALLDAMVASGRWRMVYDDAVSVLFESVQRQRLFGARPPQASAWSELRLGVRAMLENATDEAGAHFEEASRRMPNLPSACWGLAASQAVEGQCLEAEKTMRRCNRIAPDGGERMKIEAACRARSSGAPLPPQVPQGQPLPALPPPEPPSPH